MIAAWLERRRKRIARERLELEMATDRDVIRSLCVMWQASQDPSWYQWNEKTVQEAMRIVLAVVEFTKLEELQSAKTPEQLK